jgi:hypothetical protein
MKALTFSGYTVFYSLLREKAVEKDVGTMGSPGEQLYDGDIIILAKRPKGVMLVFELPK